MICTMRVMAHIVLNGMRIRDTSLNRKPLLLTNVQYAAIIISL